MIPAKKMMVFAVASIGCFLEGLSLEGKEPRPNFSRKMGTDQG